MIAGRMRAAVGGKDRTGHGSLLIIVFCILFFLARSRAEDSTGTRYQPCYPTMAMTTDKFDQAAGTGVAGGLQAVPSAP